MPWESAKPLQTLLDPILINIDLGQLILFIFKPVMAAALQIGWAPDVATWLYSPSSRVLHIPGKDECLLGNTHVQLSVDGCQ